MMRCDEVREKLPDYVYELLPDWQMEEVVAHTRSCTDCHQACQEVTEEFGLLDTWEVPGPEGDTCPEFMRGLRRHQALALAPHHAAAGVVRRPWPSALVCIPGMIRRWRALPTGAKIAVTSVSLAAVAVLAVALVALSSRRSGSAQGDGPKVIEGVPSIGWESGKTCHYIAALHACLQALGSPMRYEELMVASGAAFATGWSPGSYQYDSRVAAPEDLVVNGAVAAGGEAERRSFGSLAEAWAAVCGSIDEGRPVIASHVSAAHVICGYHPGDRQMYRQAYDVVEPGYQILPFAGERGPSRRSNEFIFVKHAAAGGLPELDWPVILSRAVRFADWPRQQQLMLGDPIVFGLGAYDEWAATLRRGVDHSGAAFDARLTVTLARTFADARAAASVVLADHATLHDSLGDAADYYMAEAEVLEGMRGVLAQGETGVYTEVMAAAEANFADPAVREQAAELVEQAREHEVMAVDALREVLRDISPEAPQPAGPGPVGAAAPGARSGRGEEYYQRGLQLKRAGRMTEAAQELGASIKADPEHAKAHFALAWILVELKETDEAAQAFGRVVELAPDSREARESRAALARMGR